MYFNEINGEENLLLQFVMDRNRYWLDYKWAGKLSFVSGSVVGSTGDLHFEIEKNIYIIAVLIVARLRIVSLDDTILLFESLAHL